MASGAKGNADMDTTKDTTKRVDTTPYPDRAQPEKVTVTTKETHDEGGAEAVGAGAGALAGAGIGMAVGGPVGAAVGGVTGAVVGAVAGESMEGNDEAGAGLGAGGGAVAGAAIGGLVAGPPGAVVGGAVGAGAGAGIGDKTEESADDDRVTVKTVEKDPMNVQRDR
jgi:uncharacterized protein YcfJ